MATGTFATAINCIDGRAQRPVTDWVKLNCHVDQVDTVTIAGADGALTRGSEAELGVVRRGVEISVRAHGSRVVAVAGHHDCAAFPGTREEHAAAIRAAARVVAGWGLGVRVVGLWVSDWWQAEVVCDSAQGPL